MSDYPVLTPKILAQEQIDQGYPSCKLFLPFNEGSGTVTKEVVSGVDIDIDQLPNSPNWITGVHGAFHGNDADERDSGVSLQGISASDEILILICGKKGVVSSTLGFNIRTDTVLRDGKIIVSGTQVIYNTDDSPTGDEVLGNTSGVFDNAVCFAGTITASSITSYNGELGSIAQDATIARDKTLGDAFFPHTSLDVRFNQGSLQGITYGAALFVFKNGIPSDLVAQLELMLGNWSNGVKMLPKEWKDLA